MSIVKKLKDKIFNGELISKKDALQLVDCNIEDICKAADEIREKFCGNDFDICTIINAKSGKCSENCKFCAQSSFYDTNIEEYQLLVSNEIVRQAQNDYDKGVQRFSLVTSGRCLKDNDIEKICESVKIIRKEVGINVCASNGLLSEKQYKMLMDSGVARIHNNLETSRNRFDSVCTTHTYDNKLDAIKAAQSAGMVVCSGGIVGMGETMEDRIDMILDISSLGIRSIPINMLNPIAGTPYEDLEKLSNEEMCQIVAIARFLVPDGFIRLAGGRGLLEDKGRRCFMSGANACISGDMLTTAGISIDTDKRMIEELGFKIKLVNE